MSVHDSDSLPVLASPGRLSAKYPGYKPADFCSTNDPKCPGTGVRDPISLQCVPRSKDSKFRTKRLVREPLPAYYNEKFKDDEGNTKVIRKVQRAPCYDAKSIRTVIETSASSQQGPNWPIGRKPITPEMEAEVRERIPPVLLTTRRRVNNESIRFLIRSGDLEGIEHWITTDVTDMSGLFYGMGTFNSDISRWDTSNVTRMTNMFSHAYSFNKPVEFDTSNVTDMSGMFSHAYSFNKPVKFDTSGVTNMSSMFSYARSFNQLLEFDTSNVTDMSSMFSNASAFNQPVEFDTSNVTDMNCMFYHAESFNQPVEFDTHNVTDMSHMFHGALTFNFPVAFNMTSVADMSFMFFDARSFNQLVKFDGIRGDTDIFDVYMFTGSHGRVSRA